jgi:hypothetical protein
MSSCHMLQLQVVQKPAHNACIERCEPARAGVSPGMLTGL